MARYPEWASMPSTIEAARIGDYARILRLARTACGLTLKEAGQLTGYSASTLSRLETGRRGACDTKELRHLAQAYQIPLDLVGLSAAPAGDVGSIVGAETDNGGDPMRRRDLLASGFLAVSAVAFAPREPVAAASEMSETFEDVLSGRHAVTAPVAGARLEAQIVAAAEDFDACRYTQLANRLPRLLMQAGDAAQQAPVDQIALASGRSARAYNIATDLLTKLHDDGMAWATSDRALQAALASGDPLIVAEAARLKAIVLRRTRHRAGAQSMIVAAAEQLAADTKLLAAGHASLYAQLLATAAYTSAINDDRDTANTLIDEAETTLRRSTADGERFTSLDVAVYKIGIARALGDFGAAVQHAQLIDPTHIASSARRARYWEDAALSLQGRGRPGAAYRALLAAEQAAPQEVRYRPWAQQLTRELITSDRRYELAGIRDFAERIGALA